MKKNKIFIKFSLAVSIYLLVFGVFTGCANTTPERTTKIHKPEIVIKINNKVVQNYILNEIKQAYVGDIVLEKGEWKIKNTFIKNKTSINDVYAETIMSISLTMYPTINSHTRRKATSNGDSTYSVPYVNYSNQAIGNIIVSKEGVILDIQGPGTFVWTKMEVPKELKNKKVFNIVDNSREDITKNKQTSTQKGFSFQLIYTGLDNDNKNMKITYKEFIDDMIRPAFSEKFSYPKSGKIIRFKKIKIFILEATNEYLKYKVIED